MDVAVAGAVAGAADLSRYGRRIVQMIWDPEPTNNTAANQPVWCLGRSYRLDTGKSKGGDSGRISSHSTSPNTPPTDATSAAPRQPGLSPDTPPDSHSSSFSSSLAYEEEEGAESGGWPSAFLDDFESRIWMTYRSGFEPIARSADPRAPAAMSFAMRLKNLGEQGGGFSSDSGWGCMIRSGQSLLANTLSIWKLGRDWRRSDGGVGEQEIISMFSDDPRAPFSIHRFVAHGEAACGKFPGEWFGPSATARCIQALANSHPGSLRVYATGDLPDVYEDSFLEVAKDGPLGEFHPTLILVGTRLGIDKVNTVYWEALTAALQMPQSAGIAGGRPSSSHYFVGSQRSVDDQGSYLFYLDPHHTRDALPFHENPADFTLEELASCHTKRLRRLHIREMDPSMLIGFLIKDEEDWDTWKSSVKHVQGKAIITVSDHDPAGGLAFGREGAIDEVEILSDDDAETGLDS